MNILFLNASPRTNGYTYKAMNIVEEHLTAQACVQWVDVNNLYKNTLPRTEPVK